MECSSWLLPQNFEGTYSSRGGHTYEQFHYHGLHKRTPLSASGPERKCWYHAAVAGAAIAAARAVAATPCFIRYSLNLTSMKSWAQVEAPSGIVSVGRGAAAADVA